MKTIDDNTSTGPRKKPRGAYHRFLKVCAWVLGICVPILIVTRIILWRDGVFDDWPWWLKASMFLDMPLAAYFVWAGLTQEPERTDKGESDET